MNKKHALKIVFDCAILYKENLADKNLLFLSLINHTKFQYIEAKFIKNNYLHLTGVVIKSSISPSYFYEKCLNKRLSFNEFEFRVDGTTELKLSVLEQLMNIYKSSKMIGDFNFSNPKLYCDILTGNIVACMGFKKDNQFYVPVTVLKQDTRDLISNQGRIIAIFSKGINEKLYNNLKYLLKDFNDKDKLPNELLSKLDSENMICKFKNCFV